MMTDPDQLAALARAVPPDVMRDAYRDLASPLLRQFAQFGEDFIKTARLALFPIQLFAAVQDRVEARLTKAITQVPEERLIAPMQSIFLNVAERLRFEPEDSVIADLYVNLLSRAMDGERVGEAHPAFVGLIAQLAPDEILFLTEIAKHEYTLMVVLPNHDWSPSSAEIDAVFEFMKQPDPRVSRARSMVFNYSSLNQPELFYVFSEHLTHMGLAEYTTFLDLDDLPFSIPSEEVYRRPRIGGAIRLTNFGKLFFKACVPTT